MFCSSHSASSHSFSEAPPRLVAPPIPFSELDFISLFFSPFCSSVNSSSHTEMSHRKEANKVNAIQRLKETNRKQEVSETNLTQKLERRIKQ
jgi:hypothetical protein